LTFSATCTSQPDATGSIANTASVSYANDPAAANNSHTDTDTLSVQANVAVTLTDNRTLAKRNDVLDYTIDVTNPGGPSTAVVTVSDALPAQLGAGSWICTGTGNATCHNGSGNTLNDSATIPVGGKAQYTYSATLQSVPALDTLVNTATATLSSGTDPVPANNSASDSDTVVIFANGFDGAGQLLANVNAAGAAAISMQLGLDAGLVATLGVAPVTIANGRSADGKQLFRLDLARFGSDLSLRAVTTDANGKTQRSSWQTVNLKQNWLQFAWQSAAQNRSDGYLSASASSGRVLMSDSSVPDRLIYLQITVEQGVPWASVIDP